MPFKTWVAGELVTAADHNEFLQEQVISTFADPAARDAVITAPEHGQYAYLRDTSVLSKFNGSVWVTVPTGLTGWASLTPSAPWTGIVNYRKAGHMVTLDVRITRTVTTLNPPITLFTMPLAFVPSASIAWVCQTWSGSSPNTTTPVALLQIDAGTGVVNLESRIENTTQLSGSVAWPTAAAV